MLYVKEENDSHGNLVDLIFACNSCWADTVSDSDAKNYREAHQFAGDFSTDYCTHCNFCGECINHVSEEHCECDGECHNNETEKPFSVGHNTNKVFPITRHTTLEGAEKRIEEIMKDDPDGVFRGEYYIDGPEELINRRGI